MRRTLLLLLTLATCLASTAALAGEPTAAEKRAAALHERRGKEAFAAGNYEECVKEFQKANIDVPSERYLYNIAKCSEKLQSYAQAIEYYTKYLEAAPNAEDRADVEIVVRVLQEKDREQRGVRLATITAEPAAQVSLLAADGSLQPLGQTPLELELPKGTHTLRFEHEGYLPEDVTAKIEEPNPTVVAVLRKSEVATIDVRSTLPEARVLIDGQSMGAPSEGPFRVEPGSHDVRVVAQGREPHVQHVIVPAGQTVEVAPVLAPFGTGNRVPQTVTTPPPSGRGSSSLDTWGYVTGGIGLALLGTGIAMGVLADQAADDANNLSPGQHDRAEHDALISDSDTYATVADVGLIVGGAAVATGITLIVVDAVSSSGPSAANAPAPKFIVSPTLVPGGAFAGATVRF